MSWNNRTVSFFILGAALLLLVPFLGSSHLFDWDEINFAEAAREMIVTGEYSYVQINFRPFWEKPPLFIWMQVLSMKLFGINEFAARFPNAICGALTLVVLFNIGQRLMSRNFGLLWVLVYAGSLLPQFYFRSGIIDPWFNLFIFIGVHQLILSTRKETLIRKHILFSGVFIGLAVLTKGPTALALVGLCCIIFFASRFKHHRWRMTDALMFLISVVLIGFSWFFLEILKGRGYIVQEFIDYHVRLFSKSEAGHGQPFYYHPIVLLSGCFPMSLFFIFGWGKGSETDSELINYKRWMNILFWVVLIVFSIVNTKIVHYSSLTYFPMSFLAALTIWKLMQGKWVLRITHKLIILLFMLVFGVTFILLGMLETIKQPLLDLLQNDQLAFANFSQHIPDGRFDTLVGIFFLVGALGSLLLIHSGRIKNGIIGLFSTTLITITLVSILIGPKIDAYTQSSLFDLYTDKADEVYFKPLGFHSYGHLFYGKRNPIHPLPKDELEWMLFGKVDRPVYFISRSQNVEKALGYFPRLTEIGRKGGYVILERTDGDYPFTGSE